MWKEKNHSVKLFGSKGWRNSKIEIKRKRRWKGERNEKWGYHVNTKTGQRGDVAGQETVQPLKMFRVVVHVLFGEQFKFNGRGGGERNAGNRVNKSWLNLPIYCLSKKLEWEKMGGGSRQKEEWAGRTRILPLKGFEKKIRSPNTHNSN